ncbi:MAG: DUF2258 domain-containing protein [Candidatus Methanomethylicota archaeon]|uniref:DUF2258 domain-containing protein n=1 Tax=Thermoproteota archaeon TaxID=2056631 RepID=A0A497ENM6_9CREN|nr:MAG: DUF2258 domain-containing protein [Candidatus Verstraetearchaeota archaeon]
MPVLSTGYIIAGACADKVRKTMFAQLRDQVKAGTLDSREVARASGEFNRVLYYILVERLKVGKGDVVRARIQYDVENGKIKWAYDTFSLEVFQRVPDEKVMGEVKQAIQQVEKLVERAPAYVVEKAITTSYGDHILYIKIGEEKVGALMVTPINEEQVLVRGAVLEPTPVIIDRTRVSLEGKPINTALTEKIADLVRTAKAVESEEAEKIVKDAEAVVESESKKIEAKPEE